MPPGLQLLLPAALLLLGALGAWFAGAAGLRTIRPLAAGSAWAALAALLAIWIPRRSPVEFHGVAIAPGLQFGQRLDALDFLLALALLLPAALLLTFQRRGWHGSGAAALTAAAGLTAVLSDSLGVTALGLGAAASIALVQVRSESDVGVRSFWPLQVAGALLLLWTAAGFQAATGTSAYSAVPVAAAPPALFALMTVGAVLASALLPWRGWTSELWDRSRGTSGSLAAAILVVPAYLVLFRTYEMGAGHWPSPVLNVGVALLGVLVAAGSAARAQAAVTRRPVLGEAGVALGGFTLVGLAIGTPLGLTAALSCVLAAAVTAALLPLLPEGRSATSLAGSVLASGLPPGLAFAARLLTIEAAVEAGTAAAFLGVLLALAWLLELASAARGARLPAPPADPASPGSMGGSLVGLALLLAGGAGYGLIAANLAVPAASSLVQFAVNSISGTPAAALSASGGWSALAVGVPLVALALLLLPALRTDLVPARRSAPDPFFGLGWAEALRAWYERVVALRLPAQYESLFNPRALEAAMARGQPVLWVVLLLVLAVAVNR